MKQHLFPVIAGMILLLLSLSCSNFNSLRIEKTNFDEEVNPAQNLVFTFNKDVMIDTSRFNKWDSTSYIDFKPAIKGKFMWTGKNELTFSPVAFLPSGTDYKASLKESLLNYSKTKWSLRKPEFEFHTPYIQLNTINSYWALSEDPARKVEIRLNLIFNGIVNPEKLKPLLQVIFDGKKQDVRILSKTDSDNIDIAFYYDIQAADDKLKGEVIIEKGLIPAGGNHASENKINVEFSIPSRDNLVISDMVSGFDNGKGIITIFTSQPVNEQDLASYITSDPVIPFEIKLLDNGMQLVGDFLEAKTYQITVKKGLKSVFDREMAEDYTKAVNFGTPEPYLSFTEKKALYLSARGEKNLGVSIVNVPNIKLTVFKVFENNIQHYMRMGMDWYWDYEDDDYYDYSSYSMDETMGNIVLQKTIATRSLPKKGNISLLNIDLNSIGFDSQFKGAYIIKVESADKKRLQDAVMVSLSDLGLIVKQGTNDIFVFVNSIKDCTPVSGARVELVSSNNQKILTANTDGQGVAIFRDYKKSAPGFNIAMVSVRTSNDFNYLLYNQTSVETSRFETGGKTTGGSVYDAFLYGDRDLYRPGDSVFFNAVVRTLRWENVTDIPVKLRLLAPNGKEINMLKYQLGKTGSASGGIALPREAMTGTYYMELYTSNNILIASRRFAVEEFMPDRIKVSATPSKTQLAVNEPFTMDVLAENLYGTPASGKKYEMEIRFNRRYFAPKSYNNYNFNISEKEVTYLNNVMKTGITGNDGKGMQQIEGFPFSDLGIVDAKIFTTVFDETGRPVNRVNTVEIATQSVFYGIRRFDTWVGTQKPLNLNFIAVDKNGKLLSGIDAEVTVVSSRYETVIENDGNSYRYVSQRKDRTMMSQTIRLNGSGKEIVFIPRESGEYRVLVKRPGSNSEVSLEFWAYGSGSTDYTSFEVDKDGEIEITPDKTAYRVGETAKLLFKAPFDGKMLVCFEQNNALEYKYIDVKNKTASLDLPLSSRHLPNIYVDATLMKKIENTQIPLTVAHGIISLKVDDPDTRLLVQLSVPESSRSGIKKEVQVKTEPGAEVTIAVVDEGILQITNYKSPDPYAWFYQKRALEVSVYDVYGLLYPELFMQKSSTAGGEAFDLSRRINPMTDKRVKLVSLWSGRMTANSSGICTFPVNIPQFSGSLRVMAVACKNNKFGAAEKSMKVADPIVISTSLPRFMSPGDQVAVAVNLSNTTKQNTSAKVSIKAGTPLSVKGSASSTINIKAGTDEVVVFNVTSTAIGSGSVNVTVDALGQQFTQDITIPVRPAQGLTYFSGAGILKGNNSLTISPTVKFMPIGTASKLMLSLSPAVQYLNRLSDLVRYPYGCMEQTTSAAFPQIYLGEIANILSQTGIEAGIDVDAAHYNVQQAINKVEAYQLYNGGFSMWPSGGNDDWWISAYITHFLIEAKNAGFETNELKISSALKYLQEKVKARETYTYFYLGSNGTILSKVYPKKEIFYSMFVLALADKSPTPTMNFYKSQASQLAGDSRYLLSAAYQLSGDRKSAQVVLPRMFPSDRISSMDGDGYASPVRDIAISLLALLDSDPTNGQIADLVRILGESITSQPYYSTQDNAFTMLAMGKFAKTNANTDVKADVSIDGKTVAHMDKKDVVVNQNFANKPVVITAKGSGKVFYYYEVSGIPVFPVASDVDNYLKVRRYYYDRNNKPVTDLKFNQNDLIRVKLEVEPMNGKTIKNVAVTDLLPACFEIENTRLQGDNAVGETEEGNAAYIDIRDDRISFFADVWSKQTYWYTVRAVSKGSYVLGPVIADAMYNGMYHSRSGSGRVEVK